MVEYKNGVYDEHSDDSPPLVRAEHAIAGLHTLEPISVEVVTIDGDPVYNHEASVSVISNDWLEEVGNNNVTNNNESSSSQQAWSAGIAGGVVATLVGGPVLGLVAGGAAAYYSQRDGAAGDITRAMGEVAETTGNKARELNEKHNLVDKSRVAADSAWKKVKAINKKHHVADRSQAAAKGAWEDIKEFDRKHSVAHKLKELAMFCMQQMMKLAEYAANRLQHLEQPSEQSANGVQTAATCSNGRVAQTNPKLTQVSAY